MDPSSIVTRTPALTATAYASQSFNTIVWASACPHPSTRRANDPVTATRGLSRPWGAAREEMTRKESAADGHQPEVQSRGRLYHRRMFAPVRALAVLATIVVAGCGGSADLRLRGGQTEAKLAQDRTECLSFVQAHPETSTQLAEAACLIARGYRTPVEMSLGPSRLGQVFTDARGDAASMVRDFQGCRVEAASAPMPEVSDTVKTGIVAGFFGQIYPRGFFTKAQTSDEWITKSFGECLKRRGYTVTDLTTFDAP